MTRLQTAGHSRFSARLRLFAHFRDGSGPMARERGAGR